MVLAADDNTIACMPRGFVDIINYLSEEQIRKVVELGFGEILHLHSFSIGILTCKYLADAYNEKEGKFKIGDKSLPLSLRDVVCVMGLKNEGKKIIVNKEPVNEALFQTYADPKSKQITCDDLVDQIKKSKVADEHFVRRFVLLLIGTILAPKQRGVVSRCFLNLVENVSEISGLNWAELTLSELIKSIKSYKGDRKSCLGGNLVLLKFWYYEHFENPEDKPDNIFFPLLVNWDQDRILERQVFYAKNGHGSGIFIPRLSTTTKKGATSNLKSNFKPEDTSKKGRSEENIHTRTDNLSEIKILFAEMNKRMEKMEENIKILLAEVLQHWGTNGIDGKLSGKQDNNDVPRNGTASHNSIEFVDNQSDNGASYENGTAKGQELVVNLSSGSEKSNEKHSHQTEESDTSLKICSHPKTPTLAQRAKEHARERQKSRLENVAYNYAKKHIYASPHKVLACIYGLTDLTGSKLEALVDNNRWLCDSIMDNYILMIEHNRAENDKVSLQVYTTTHYMMSMSKSKRLTNRNKLAVANKAEKWLEHDMVLFPMNHGDHWFVGVLHFGKENFQILDSKPKPADSYTIPTRALRLGISKSFKALAQLKSVDLNFQQKDIFKWAVRVIENLPGQSDSDSDSCGVFALKYMQFWDGEGLLQSFSETDIPALRKQMTVELLLSPDNHIVDVQKEIHELAVGKGYKVGDFKA